METRKILAIVVLALCLMVCQVKIGEAADVGTAFTYQGRLLDANSPADGLYDFMFTLYDSNDACDLVAGPVEVNDLDVIEGYFTTELDFGQVFDGNDLWLKIGVRPGELTEPEDYISLNPLVELTPAPHAIYADIAGSDSDWMVSGNDMYSIPSGNVGIGTTSPSAKVTINDNITNVMPGVPGLMIGNNGNSAVWVGKDSDNYGAFEWIDPYLRIWSEDEVRFALGGQQDKIVFDSSGNVGIGTSPSAKLHIAGSQPALMLETSATFQSSIQFIASGDPKWAIFTDDGGSSQNNLSFRDMAAGATRLFIDPSGNVGIGMTGPSYKLEVDGSLYAQTVDTGQGNNEVYPMDQPLRTVDSVAFSTVNTGQGDNELYAMNQNVRTSDNPTFNRVHLSDYGTALGGFHVGGTSDPGTDNLTVDGQVYVPNMENAGAATAYEVLWQSDKLVKGNISSSSARYKEDIRPLQDDFNRILQAQCRSFVFKESNEDEIGFIAEEFAALGLDNLVIYREGRPDGIKYDKVPLYLLEVLKDQAKTTEQLKAENRSLTERLEALERAVQQLVKTKEVQL